jgi:hypothetical protein
MDSQEDNVMKRRLILSSLLVGLSATIALAETPAVKDQVLMSGTYTAQVTAIPCEGCPPVIEKTMLDQQGILSAKADQKTSTLTFTVKPEAQVNVSDLQKALKSASDEMGMGADYTLKNVKKAG